MTDDPMRQAGLERRLANLAKAPRCGARTRTERCKQGRGAVPLVIVALAGQGAIQVALRRARGPAARLKHFAYLRPEPNFSCFGNHPDLQ